MALCLVREHKHFPVSLLKTSPTAMGLISYALPSFSLFKAIRLPPAKYLETKRGTLPDARRLTMSLREEHMDVSSGILAASSRCWTRRPEGPAAVPLGNERRAPKMSKSSSIDMGDRAEGTMGGGELGCLEIKSCHVASLLGANPADKRILQAFPNMPAFAKEIADSISF